MSPPGGVDLSKLTFYENFLLGGAAAVTSKTCAAPLERVKLLMQNQGEILKSGRLDRPYNGIADCMVRTFRNEGILPFWRGNFANCIRYFPTQALNFAFKDKVRAMFGAELPTDTYLTKFTKNIGAGGTAGALSLCFVYSLDFCFTRLANDALSAKAGAQRQFRGMTDVYIQTIKTDGVRGLYRGFVISCVGIIVYRGCFFGFYDSLKPIMLGENAGLVVSFMLGYVVTIGSELMAYPIDTVRRRMMMTSGEAVKYRGAIHCASEIVRKEGGMALMRGAGANMIRGVAGAGVLAGFDKFKELYVYLRTRYN